MENIRITIPALKESFQSSKKDNDFIIPSSPSHPSLTGTQNNSSHNTASPTSTNSSKSAAIAAAALSQIGVSQDCTMLVTNSLAAAGISFHGWPEDYLSLGTVTSNPVPGDIIVYQGHVAVYVGNGQAVHGGWNGSTTVLTSVNCSQPFIAYVHIN